MRSKVSSTWILAAAVLGAPAAWAQNQNDAEIACRESTEKHLNLRRLLRQSGYSPD